MRTIYSRRALIGSDIRVWLPVVVCLSLGVTVALSKPKDKESRKPSVVEERLTFDEAVALYGLNTEQDETSRALAKHLREQDARAACDTNLDGETMAALREPLTNGIWTSIWGFQTTIPVHGDYDGDGFGDLAVWDSNPNYLWYIYSPEKEMDILWGEQWGMNGAIPVPGDYNGDGKDDLAMYDRLGGGNWFIRTLSGVVLAWGQSWGWNGAIPVAGDYDGDGVADLAVFDPSNGNWFIRTMSGPALLYGHQWGWSGAIPVPGDYDGDGADDLAVYNSANGHWYLQKLNGEVILWDKQWGGADTVPVSGRFFRDCSAMAVYKVVSGQMQWYVRNLAGFVLHWDKALGQSGDRPAPIDLDGWGVDYPAVMRPSDGLWQVLVDGDLDTLPDGFEMFYWNNLGQTAAGDPDSDGLSNGQELTHETDPTQADTDGDGTNDGVEIGLGSDPLNAASFPVDISGTVTYQGQQSGQYRVEAWRDGVLASYWQGPGSQFVLQAPTLKTSSLIAYRDSNGNGLRDAMEAQSDPLSITPTNDLTGIVLALLDVDTDGDGMPDWWEALYFGGPTNALWWEDPDSDGLNNLEEYQAGTDPTNPDTDGDGMNDGGEIAQGFDPAVFNDSAAVQILFPENGRRLP